MGVLLSSALSSTPALAARARGALNPAPALGMTAVPSAESVGSERPSDFEAGSLVQIRWSGLPESAREVELLLSVDGGRTYSLRVTDELDPKDGSYFWKVPRLKAERARLAIRMGVGGREVIAATTPEFEIAPDRSAERIRLRWHSGEIWTTSSEETEPADTEPGRGLSGAPEGMTGIPESFDAVEVPTRAAQYSASPRRAVRESRIARVSCRRSFEPVRPSPQTIPQRI